MIKKTILNQLKKRGYDLRKKDEFDQNYVHQSKYIEVFDEHYKLAQSSLLSLPNELPASIKETSLKLIGTSPYEGLAVLNSLYETHNLEGVVCEFGVAQGATSKMIASFLQEKNSQKNLHLFDSFEGLPEPTQEDQLIDDVFNLGNMKAYKGKMAYAKAIVLARMNKLDFSLDQLTIHEGFVDEEILSLIEPEQVSFAYIDFDFYKPIQYALEWLNTRLPIGGIMIVDDYDFFSSGAKMAVDEFYMENKASYSIEIPSKQLGHFAKLKRLK